MSYTCIKTQRTPLKNATLTQEVILIMRVLVSSRVELHPREKSILKSVLCLYRENPRFYNTPPIYIKL